MLESLRRKFRLKLLGAAPPAAEDAFHSFEDLVREGTLHSRALRAGGYLEFPNFVHLETLALCNAACDFCPYPSIARKGARMPDALIEKVIGDLADAPRGPPFLFAPYKVSEPFLEPRLFDIIARVAERLPNARVALISNGAALIERQVARLAAMPNIAYLSVSLNFDNAAEYEAVMQIPFARTLERLDALHARKAAGELRFAVQVARVSGGAAADARFVRFVETRYPAYKVRVSPRNDWLGDVITPGASARIPDAPCHRWFDMSVVATGEVAMCCMDGDAAWSKGNVAERHLLELYNQPHLRHLREALPSRKRAGAPCEACTYVTG